MRTFIKMWEHNSWGNKIMWMNADFANNGGVGTLYGFLPKAPKLGDVVIAEMTKGLAAFLIETIDPKDNPPDMFFATTAYVGHLEEGQSVADFVADVVSGGIDLQDCKQQAQRAFGKEPHE